MKMHFIVPALAGLASTVLAGCAGGGSFIGPQGGSNSVGAVVLQHIEQCDRHYQGAIGVGITGAFEISCKAQPPASPAGGAGASVATDKSE